MGGFHNAHDVGVLPVIEGRDGFPDAYKQGVVEGALFSSNGKIGLIKWRTIDFVAIVSSLPESKAAETLSGLTDRIQGCVWNLDWRKGEAEVDPEEVISALHEAGAELGGKLDEAYRLLCDELEACAEGSSS